MAMFAKICLNEIKYVQKKKKIYQDCNSRWIFKVIFISPKFTNMGIAFLNEKLYF